MAKRQYKPSALEVRNLQDKVARAASRLLSARQAIDASDLDEAAVEFSLIETEISCLIDDDNEIRDSS